MSSKTIVKVKLDMGTVDKMDRRAVMGVFQAGADIASRARLRAPYLTGALSNSIRVSQVGNGDVEVIAGGVFGTRAVDYAMIRENGPNRNPATEHYMENATKDILLAPNFQQHYFGSVAE